MDLTRFWAKGTANYMFILYSVCVCVRVCVSVRIFALYTCLCVDADKQVTSENITKAPKRNEHTPYQRST